jgi:hypothetical protein
MDRAKNPSKAMAQPNNKPNIVRLEKPLIPSPISDDDHIPDL